MWQSIMIVILTLWLGGCERRAETLDTMRTKIGGREFVLEVANTEARRRDGLMYRQTMAEDHGMLFVFPDEQPRSFWMKNTTIPLDIIFLDSNGKVVSIHGMKPLDLQTTSSSGPAQYAIELNRGMADAAGVREGDIVRLPAHLKAVE